jgi:hypothetical protein
VEPAAPVAQEETVSQAVVGLPVESGATAVMAVRVEQEAMLSSMPVQRSLD